MWGERVCVGGGGGETSMCVCSLTLTSSPIYNSGFMSDTRHRMLILVGGARRGSVS